MIQLKRFGQFLFSLGGWLVIIGLLLFGASVISALEYQPGDQDIFPLYWPMNDIQVPPDEYLNALRGENSVAESFYFGSDWLGLEEPQAALMAAILFNISQTDPYYSNLINGVERCGVAAWGCQSERYQTLLEFAEGHNFNANTLKVQLFFIGFETHPNFNKLGWGVSGASTQKQFLIDLAGTDLASVDDNQIATLVTSYVDGFSFDRALQLAPQIRLSAQDILQNYQEVKPQPPPEPQTEPPPAESPKLQTPTKKPQQIPQLKVKTYSVDNCTFQRPRPIGASKPPLKSVPIAGTKTSVSGGVHQCLAESAEALFGELNSYLSQQAEDPVIASGWRSQARQVELRKLNGCPDVYKSRASTCRVPTSIPGYSMHESGLALDFHHYRNNKLSRTINRQDKAFEWLSDNAHRFGLKNLKSEAWHWSINAK